MTRRPLNVPYSSVAVMLPTAIVERIEFAAERDGYGWEKGDRQRFFYDVLVEATKRSERGEPIVTAEVEAA
jgi:hypothetical protein